MIRATTPEDTDSLVELAAKTGVFKPLEIQALREVLSDYFASNQKLGHQCVTLASENGIEGFAYFAPEAMTEGTWSLWWIAVHPAKQRSGLGAQLLQHVERTAAQAKARVLFIDTSSLAHYSPTRQFYARHGYQIAGTLADWYARGDDKVIFRKMLSQDE